MNVTLAIESAIAGGSLSLLDDTGTEIAGWIGASTAVARAEDLLSNIEALLTSAGVAKNDLSLIAVSAGPGSFTGIRVGMATALGLKNGLNVQMCSISVLSAIVTAKGHLANKVADPVFCSVVPSGRNAVCLQSFEVGQWSQREISEPLTIRDSQLAAFIEEQQEFHFLLHSDLAEHLTNAQRVTDVGRDLAQFVAVACLADRLSTAPIFVSKSF